MILPKRPSVSAIFDPLSVAIYRRVLSLPEGSTKMALVQTKEWMNGFVDVKVLLNST
jgi:hypothetical protein